MIWRRIKKVTKEQDREFSERMEEAKLTFKDKLAMVLAGYAVLLLPALVILIVLAVLACLLMGII